MRHLLRRFTGHPFHGDLKRKPSGIHSTAVVDRSVSVSSSFPSSDAGWGSCPSSVGRALPQAPWGYGHGTSRQQTGPMSRMIRAVKDRLGHACEKRAGKRGQTAHQSIPDQDKNEGLNLVFVEMASRRVLTNRREASGIRHSHIVPLTVD